MKKLSYLVLAATIASVGVSAAPAFAATTAGNVPMCSTGNSDSNQHLNQQALARQLHLNTTSSSHSIDVWNGCFKVLSTSADGTTTTSFYDPDSLKLVATL